MPARAISLEQARNQYPHRFTMEHVPSWAKWPAKHTKGEHAGKVMHYAPQYRTDREWYEHTAFPGEPGHPAYGILSAHKETQCHTTGQTWPMGQWLEQPYSARTGVLA